MMEPVHGSMGGRTPNAADTGRKIAVTVVFVVSVILVGRLLSPWFGGGVAGDAYGGAIGAAVGWGVCKFLRFL